MTRKQRVTRVVYGVYVVFVAAFVTSSIAQVARAVFGGPKTETEAADATRFPRVGPDCGERLKEQLSAIEMARLVAGSEPSEDAARARYARERSTSAERKAELERVCSGDPHGNDALAALTSFDRAAETHAVRDAAELSPVRLVAQSFISGHPR